MIPFALMVGAVIMIALMLRSVLTHLAAVRFAKYLTGETGVVAMIGTGLMATDIDARWPVTSLHVSTSLVLFIIFKGKGWIGTTRIHYRINNVIITISLCIGAMRLTVVKINCSSIFRLLPIPGRSFQ